MRAVRCVSTVLALLAAALSPALQAVEAPAAAFVTLGQTDAGEQFALARVVIEQAGADCPALEPTGGGQARPMTARRNPDPRHFGVTVCEAVYPTHGSRLRVAGSSVRLPAVPAEVSRLVVLGDTGCEPAYQDGCNASAWPFAELADSAAEPTSALVPDLVVHVGDYNYRGTPGEIEIKRPGEPARKVQVYDAGDNAPGATCKLSGPYYGQNSVGSRSPDAWPPWQQDFFMPARRLLLSAPWIFARGNHELCSRAGPGYFYLLDPGSDLVPGSGGQLACPPAEAAEPLVFRRPYRIDLGELAVVVLDSANACDQGDLHQGHFDAQFARVRSLVRAASAEQAIWLLTHRPLWGVNKPEDDTPQSDLDASGKYLVIDKTLQTAYAREPLPKPVRLVLSGHMHRFQAIAFEPLGELPSQLIVGNGGVDLDANYPEEPFAVDIGEATAVGFGLSRFGYLDIALHGRGWSGRLLNPAGNPLARCGSARTGPTGVCEPAGN
jgi:hypothetical protein